MPQVIGGEDHSNGATDQAFVGRAQGCAGVASTVASANGQGARTRAGRLLRLDGASVRRWSAPNWLCRSRPNGRETPKSLDIHLIQDNYATHKHAKVKAWLSRHPRFKSHFTPTSSSWMSLVERFFVDLTTDVIRTGSFGSVAELVRDIKAYRDQRNENRASTLGRRKAPQSSKRSSAPVPPSTKSRQHELLVAN